MLVEEAVARGEEVGLVLVPGVHGPMHGIDLGQMALEGAPAPDDNPADGVDVAGCLVKCFVACLLSCILCIRSHHIKTRSSKKRKT